MDHRRFDSLARAVASGASRRDVVRAVAAGAAASLVGVGRQRRVAAQTTDVPIGGQCSALGADSECSQIGTPDGGIPVVCSDNGIREDGDFNCCRPVGGACSADFHCCGTGLCLGNVCAGSNTTGGGLGLGEACTSTTQCSQSGGATACASNGIDEDGARNCCRTSGGGCASDSHCCTGRYCVNGVCGGSGGAGDIAPGAECATSDQCSQAGGATICADNGYSTDGALNCCRQDGGACTDAVNSADCCYGYYCVNGICSANGDTGSGLALGTACASSDQCNQAGGAVVCADNGITADGDLNCCREGGGACGVDSHCCYGLFCVSGVCSASTSSGLLELGAACTSDGQCSQEGGAVSCADNGIVSDGDLNCCRYDGGACWSAGGCCTGYDCVNGACTPIGGGASGGLLAITAACTSTDQCSQDGGPVACDDNGIVTDGERNCCRYYGGACWSDLGCCAGYFCRDGVCS